MAESIIVYFATVDRAAVAKLLRESGCSKTDDQRWQYPRSGMPTLLLAPYTDLDSEYDEDDRRAIFTRLGGRPACAVIVELRRHFSSRAVDDATDLCRRLLGQADGVVDDTYSELWTCTEIQTRAIKRDGSFLECYRNAGAGEPFRRVVDPDATRWLRWYELNGNNLVDEEQVTQASLAQLQEIFGTTPDDPMFECYPVAAQHIQRLATFVSQPIELSRFAYFVEADAILPRTGAHG